MIQQQSQNTTQSSVPEISISSSTSIGMLNTTTNSTNSNDSEIRVKAAYNGYVFFIYLKLISIIYIII